MEPHDLSLLPLLVADVSSAIGAVVALFVLLAFVCLGVLLPGVLVALGGPAPDRREASPEFGPAASPVISGPAPRGAVPSEAKQDRGRRVARPHLWRHLSGISVMPPASPAGSIER